MVLYGFYSHLSCEVEDLSSRPCVCVQRFHIAPRWSSPQDFHNTAQTSDKSWDKLMWKACRRHVSWFLMRRKTTDISGRFVEANHNYSTSTPQRTEQAHAFFFLPSFQEINNRSATWLINLWFVHTLPSPQIHSHILRSVKIKYKNKSQEILIPSINWWLYSRSAYPKKIYSKLYHPNK